MDDHTAQQSTPPPPYELVEVQQLPHRRSLEWALHFQPFEWTRPCWQFEAQVVQEIRRMCYMLNDSLYREHKTSKWVKFNDQWSIVDNAKHNVKQRWVERGIWNPNWEHSHHFGRWKHEEHDRPDDTALHEELYAMGRYMNVDGEPVKQIFSAAECEASRPYRQFEDQVAYERSRIRELDEWTYHGHVDNADIDDRAKATVLKFWVETRIWNSEWREVPGSSWKHERFPLSHWQTNEVMDLPNDPVRVDRDTESLVQSPAAELSGTVTETSLEWSDVEQPPSAHTRVQYSSEEDAQTSSIQKRKRSLSEAESDNDSDTSGSLKTKSARIQLQEEPGSRSPE